MLPPLAYVITHPLRLSKGQELAGNIDAKLLEDINGIGTTRMHMSALAAADTYPALVLEDDAQPVPSFGYLAYEWITRFPENIISFYLGTGHPIHWMKEVDKQWGNSLDYVQLPELIHGVTYVTPPGVAGEIAHLMDPARPADYSIGEAWRRLSTNPIIYPKESLVDHEDGPPITETSHKRPTRAPRKARQLAG